MPSRSTGESSAGEDPPHGDLTAAGSTVSRPGDEGPERSAPESVPVDHARRQDRSSPASPQTTQPPPSILRNRSRRKKIWTPVALAVAGLALFFGAVKIFPSRPELPTPPYSIASIFTNYHGVLALNIYISQRSPSIATITFSANVLPYANAYATVNYSLPGNATPLKCSPSCGTSRIALSDGWTFTMDFKSGANDRDTLLVKTDGTLGYTANGVTASAALPELQLDGPSGQTADMFIQYNIPSADSYDWSASPTFQTTGDSATWNEELTDGGLPTSTAVGTNHANQAKDNRNTFLAGALVGLAGGALLSAVQEALHAND